MSERYEFSEAAHTSFSVAPEGEELGMDTVAPGELAVVIGDASASAYVLTGTREEILVLLRRLMVEVQFVPAPAVEAVRRQAGSYQPERADYVPFDGDGFSGRTRRTATNYLEQAEALPVWPAIGTGGNR